MTSRFSPRSLLATVVAVALAATGVTALAATPAAADPAVTVTTLEVENRTEPLGIDVAAPRFSWVTETSARDVTQQSYRIRVGTSPTTIGDAWDSGTVASDASSAIEYDGATLSSTTDYYWRVDVGTTAGDATATSTFSTGMFDAADWADSQWIGRARTSTTDALSFTGSQWIWTPESGAPYAPGEPRAFRKTLTTPDGKTAATGEIIITADDSYKLWINGTVVGETAGNENEWQGSRRFLVDLSAASNTIAVRSTNGANTPAGLLMGIRVTYSDGSREVFRTDATWKAIKTIPTGFEAVGFDDSAWPAAVVQATYGTGPWGTGVNKPADVPAAAPLLRKQFDVASAVASAKIYVAAGGYANVSLNGSPINDEILSPGFTDYDDHAQYVVTDVTDRLEPGDNAIGMELGRGFYGMTNGNVWNWQNAPWHDEPVGRAVLRIQYVNGDVENIVTDDSWQLHDGPTLLDDLYGGETYDARKVQTGFDTASFSGTGWIAASEVAGPKGTLINQQQQPIRVTERIAAESITTVASGDYVVKFPRMLAGNVEFTAQGAAGTTIRAQYGEKLLGDGRPNFSNNGGFQNGFQTDRFILAGTGAPETWAGKFSYKGFQYIEVTGWPGTDAPPLSAFTALAIHTDAPETGSFDSSSDIMNKTHRAVVDTLFNNIHSIPTDTPMFEKNGWTGDAAVGAEMFLTNMDAQNLFEKWIGDINDTRDADGAPMVIAPSSAGWGEWGVAPPWHSAYILIPWWLYQYGGDSQVLAKYYDGMKAYVDLEFDRSPGGVVPSNRLGDWVSPEASPAGGNAPEDARVSGTAYLYTMLTSMQKTATLLGKTADATAFASHAATVKTGFNAAFLDQAAGYYRGTGDAGYRQTHNVLALEFGLAPDAATAKRVAASLAADVVAKGNKLNTGSLGTKYLLPVLSDYGYTDLAYKVAVQTAYPSWGYMIENGATSMWEHWSLDARSRGHYFLGTVDDWFYQYAAGIRSSDETGYRDITIQPAVTADLDWAKATTNTPFGPVSVDWKRTGDQLSVKTHVPVGSTAVVHLPASTTWAISEGGNRLDAVDGVHAVSVDGDDVLVTVGSGDYDFTVDSSLEPIGTVLDRIDELKAMVTADDGTAVLDSIRDDALAALDADAPAENLADALGTLDEFDALASSDGIDSTPLRDALNTTITGLLGIALTAVTDVASYEPGDTATVTATVTNGGVSALTDVTAAVTGWTVEPSTPATVAAALAVGAHASTQFAVTVPAEQLPGTRPVTVEASYRYHGVIVRAVASVDLVIDARTGLTTVTLSPTTAAPGGTSTLTAVVHNDGKKAIAGHLAVTVPTGWVVPLATRDVVIAAGASESIAVPVFVPLGAENSPSANSIGAKFVFDDVTLASGAATLTVTLPAVTVVPTGYDRIDLGNATSEQAHALTASSSSGTNSEAGLTRRYAGHLTDNSYFEFDAKVIANKPFAIRAIETYDRAQTKKYKIFVDGVEVKQRVYSHTTGVGTETFEFVVPASFATDASVRIRFQNLTDHTFYDPSIADVWTLPVAADATAPQLSATTDPATGSRATGWYRQSPVTVSFATVDDRDAEPTLEYAVGDSAFAPYDEPLSLDDGRYEITARATDATEHTTTATFPVNVDSVAPHTLATLGAGFVDGVAQNSGTVDFAASDATSGVSESRYRVNGGAEKTGDSVTITEGGDFTVSYYSVDVAGNAEAASTITGEVVIPDVTAPAVDLQVSHAGAAGWYLGGATATLSATDSQSGVASLEYRVGSGAWTAYTAPIMLAEGATTFAYRATDVDGNVSTVVEQVLRVDSVKPTVTAALAARSFVITAADANPVTAEYSLDGAAWAPYSAPVALDAAAHRLQFRATDAAGNTSDVGQLSVPAAANAPVVTVNPAKRVSVKVGSTVTLVAAATGDPAPSVQWEVSTNNGKSWKSVTGATSGTYRFSPDGDDQGDRYRARFSNATATVYSSVATITVTLVATTVKVKLADATISTGTKAVVTVTVSAKPGKPTGTVTVHYGSKSKKVKVGASGKVKVTLPKLKKGSYRVYASYAGSARYAADTSPKLTLTVR